MGKFCPGRWDVFCHVITGARIVERVNHLFWSKNSFQHAQLAIFLSRELFIRNSGLVRGQSVWPGSWDLGSFVPGSHRAGQLASSYERNKCFCMDNRRSAGSRPSGPSHLPGPYEQALTEANIYHWAIPKQRTKSGKRK